VYDESLIIASTVQDFMYVCTNMYVCIDLQPAHAFPGVPLQQEA
jgi:hypothetical protein